MSTFLQQAQQGTAGLLLARAGAKTSFQLYATTNDLEAGSEDGTASGSPVLAAMVRDVETRSRAGADNNGSRPVVTRQEVFHVEVPAFGPDGLTKDWRPTVNGKEQIVENVIMSPDETFWVVKLSTGGAP